MIRWGYRPQKKIIFQSTPSVWRETVMGAIPEAVWTISIHSLRVEGDRPEYMMYIHPVISIHSLRVEGDGTGRLYLPDTAYFNPLPPCGGRPKSEISSLAYSRFQSTPSVWRETQVIVIRKCVIFYFNPLPPCGGRLRKCENL